MGEPIVSVASCTVGLLFTVERKMALRARHSLRNMLT